MSRALTLAAFAASLCLWLGANTKPPKVDNFPRNALRGSVEAIRLPDKGGWELRYHKTDKVDLRANFPTFAQAREAILQGLTESNLTAEELRAAGEDLNALEQEMGETL